MKLRDESRSQHGTVARWRGSGAVIGDLSTMAPKDSATSRVGVADAIKLYHRATTNNSNNPFQAVSEKKKKLVEFLEPLMPIILRSFGHSSATKNPKKKLKKIDPAAEAKGHNSGVSPCAGSAVRSKMVGVSHWYIPCLVNISH